MVHMAIRVQKSLDLSVLDNIEVFLPIVWVVLDDGGKCACYCRQS